MRTLVPTESLLLPRYARARLSLNSSPPSRLAARRPIPPRRAFAVKADPAGGTGREFELVRVGPEAGDEVPHCIAVVELCERKGSIGAVLPGTELENRVLDQLGARITLALLEAPAQASAPASFMSRTPLFEPSDGPGE
jgi:hypothetical protein